LSDYAAFRAACEQRETSWHNWPTRMRNGELRAGDYSRDTWRYYSYVQWLCREQLQKAIAEGRRAGVQFYLDLPVGVNSGGYDAWRERELFALNATVGAPPDPFFPAGQGWGFSPLHPRKLREQRYRYFIEFIRFQMRATGLLRIDHVMGLRRLFWIPHGRPATEGAYVRYAEEELFALLSLESHRHQTMLVGENLGTVPPEVNERMQRHRVRQMYVVQYELKPSRRHALPKPSRDCVASLNTHDMPTFAAFCRGKDIGDRARLGWIPQGNIAREKAARQKLLGALRSFLKREGFLGKAGASVAETLEGCLKFLGASDAEIVLINLEDLWLEERPQNVPGTCKERPNWQRKARLPLERIVRNKRIARLLDRLQEARTRASHHHGNIP
jgi:4-alpha-glucanotransferase